VSALSEAGRHRIVRPEPGEALTADTLEARLLGKPATMGRRDVSRGAQVSLLSARKFWHALGFPIVEDEDAMFTEADLMALKAVARLVREEQLDETTALAMTRAFARTTDRLAVWQTQLMAEAMAAPELTPALDEADARAVPDLSAAEASALKLAEMADSLEPLLVYAWRRHLTAAISRMLADADPEQASQGVRRVVGFADLVNFTSLVRRMTERQLAVMVQRFEALATDIVTAHGGRVIKTVGDEILFVTIDAAPAAAVALDLVDTMGEDDLLPDVRVGMAFGPVLSRLGDVFGTTVNRASRLTSVAPAGRVLVDDALTAALASLSGFETSPLRRRTLRGIGPVTPSELRRARSGRGGVAEPPSATLHLPKSVPLADGDDREVHP
jgi:adenylate cyclase